MQRLAKRIGVVKSLSMWPISRGRRRGRPRRHHESVPDARDATLAGHP